MRHHMNEALIRAELLQKANEKVAHDAQAVLEEMTRNRSVFTKKDVEFFLTKHVPSEVKGVLLEKVLEHADVVPLYDKANGKETAHCTTKTVRLEEEKLLRFADSIANKRTFALGTVAAEKGLEGRTLTPEQREAYDLCVNSKQNLCIIQGRAGVGKSYVLGAIREAHECSHFRVLGLAPTHKVTMDLKKDGFKEAKTCHSFLFAFKNGREKLDSKTVVVVDEAGMLGTTLSVELFNVIKSSGAKLVLVGDDRQLSSVERGGAFKFLSERYGAVELRDVRRQSIAWQKAVSEALAEGKIKDAVQLLEDNKAISWAPTKEESHSELLKTWSRDNLLNPHETRQIITQKNVDVDALNQGVRDILRAQGKLGDTEIICNTQRGRIAFAEGDRVQFTTTDKEQGLVNASFGFIEHIDPKTKKLTIRLDNREVKEVDPDTYDGLRHGYASTVYKVQGATLPHIYALHSRTTNHATNYVTLSRQTKSLRLYVSHDETPSQAALIQQMERQDGKGTSLVFDTIKDIEKRQVEQGISTQLKHGAELLLTKIKDVFHKNKKFYQFEKPANMNQGKAEVVAGKLQDELGVQVENKRQEISKLHNENKGGSLPYQKDAERTLRKSADQRIPQLKPSAASSNLDAKIVEEALRQNISSFADDIFSSIGEPYHPASSSATERRYGKKGHISVNLKTGAWIDYKNSDLAGGPIHMLIKLKSLSFKEALDYGANWVGLSGADLARPQDGKKQSSFKATAPFLPHREEPNRDEEAQAKIAKVQTLWDKGQPIQGTLAERYLREHRKIEGSLPSDLRYLPVFTDIASKKSFPCLIAAARSPKGELSSVQVTFLDPATAAKENIDVAKKSFGLIKGSAVTLQGDSTQENPSLENTLTERKYSNVLIIAEGVETALSLKEAGIQGTIKASLGISNIKRIVSESSNTHVVICADHDAPGSPAAKSLEKAVVALKEKGLSVSVIKPDKLGEDFNDVLKREGPQGVREIFEMSLSDGKLPRDLIKLAPKEKGASLEVASFNPSPIDKGSFEERATKSKTAEGGFNIALQEAVNKATPLNNSIPLVQTPLKTTPALPTGEMVFEGLAQQCKQILYAYLRQEKRALNPDLIARVEKQADKAANYIFHAHTVLGTRPTDKQTEHFLLRAKYELNRIAEIRDELTHKWRQVGCYHGEKDELNAHMMAERQASIEGRMYLEAKQRGQTPSSNISEIAKREIEQSNAVENRLTQDLKTKKHLSEGSAAFCAKDIMRFVETHGQKPTAEQISAMAQISRNLEKESYNSSIGLHNIEYFRRRDGELHFREWSASNKDLSGFREFPYAAQDYTQPKSPTKSYNREELTPKQEENLKGNEMDFSM